MKIAVVAGARPKYVNDDTKSIENITIGTGELIETNPQEVLSAFEKFFSGNWKHGGEIPQWDRKPTEKQSIICRNWTS